MQRAPGIRGLDLPYFGDGATSEGAFHEGANLAGVMRAPLVLLQQQPVGDLDAALGADARRDPRRQGAGYGIPGVRVDGCDVLAVYEATREAVERARAGDGPTFIEAVTYRAAPHATADDPKAYIDLERVEEERAASASAATRATCAALGSSPTTTAEVIKGEASEVMRDGIAEAEAEPPADPALVFEHAYVDPPAPFERDLAELRRILLDG